METTTMVTAPERTNQQLTEQRKQWFREVIEKIESYDVAFASQILDDRIRALRQMNREEIMEGDMVKIYTQTNEIHGRIVSIASVQAVVSLVDNSEEKVDIAVLSRVE